MSDETPQGPIPEENNPAHQENDPVEQTPPAQETFGEFSEVPNVPAEPAGYANPENYTNPASGNPPPTFGYAVPPRAFYGPPPNTNQAPPSRPPATPLPLWAAMRQLPRQYWYVLTHPTPATFIEEQGKAAWNIVWAQIGLLALVGAVFALLIVLLEFFIFQAFAPQASMAFVSVGLLIAAIAIVIGTIVLVPASFFIGTGIYHLIARAFGGQGSFLSYAYSYTLVVVPLGILSTAFAIIPCIGSVVGMGAAIYEIVLLIYMTMGIQRLSGGKATAVILIPIAVSVVLITGLYYAYFILIFSLVPRH